MSPAHGPALGIDVGGTTIKLGLVDASGQVLARSRIAYASFGSFEALADSLAEQARSMERAAAHTACGVGVAAPGHARSGDGLMVDGTANVPLLRRQSLAAALRERLMLPVATVNDGIAAALGELRFGAGRGLDRFVVITLGTGVGGGVAIDARVLTGSDGEPPEIGAMVLDAASKPPRTLEDFACASGFAAAYRRHGGAVQVSPQELFARAAAGDETARLAIADTGRRIAQAVGILINTLNLQSCLIGGGIAGAGEPLLAPIRSSLPDFTWPYLLERARVELALTGADAGILGAAVSAFQAGQV